MHLSSARMLTLGQNRQVTESAWVSHILSYAKEPYVHHSKSELTLLDIAQNQHRDLRNTAIAKLSDSSDASLLCLRLHSNEDYSLCLGFVIVPLS